MLKVRKGSGEEIPLVQGKEQWLRFAGAAVKRYPTPKVKGGDERSYPASKSGAAAGRSYPTLKVRKGGCEEIPHVQGKEQRLRFARTAVKRYPTPKVRETQV